MARARDVFRRRPAEAIDALCYVCTNDPSPLRRAHVDALCRQAPARPLQPFSALRYVLAWYDDDAPSGRSHPRSIGQPPPA